MTRFDNNAEGGSNGASATAADTGSGTQWTSVVGNPIYTSSGPLSDALSILFSTTATQFVAWTDTASASGTFRFELSVPSAPSGDHRILDIRSSSASLGNIIMPSGTTTLTANSGTGASATTAATTALTAGSKYTITGTMTGWGTSSSVITLKVYDSTGTLVDTKASSGGTTASTINILRYGRPTSTASNMATGMKMDNLAQDLGTAVEIGPVSAPSFSGSASYSGAGTLTSNATIGAAGSASLSGAGTMSAAGAPRATGSASTSGSGTLSPLGAPAVTGSAALSGTGTLAAAGSPRVTGSAALAGAGTLTSVAGLSVGGVGALSGGGTLTAAASGAGFGTATLTGSGTLTATGVPSVPGVAALGGVGTLGSGGTPSPQGTAGLSGSGTLATVVVPNIAAALGLSGTGTLQAAAQGTSFGTGTLAGAGTLTAAATLSVAGAAGLSGVGALSAFGQVAGPITASAALAGAGTLSAAAIVSLTGSVQLGSIGYLRDTGGSRVGFTPSNEMVTVAWLKAAVPYLGNRVATELPADNSSWSASGFTTVATTGGTPNTEVPVNEPVMSIDSWGVSLNSGRPPWNLAAQPAEAIKAAAVAHGLIPKILTMPAGFNQVRVFSVTPRTEPRRIPGDGAGYAHYQQDLHLRWVSA
jgi:hypothetical protein